MNSFIRRVRRTQATKPASAHRSRSFRPQAGQLDERLVPSPMASHHQHLSPRKLL